MHILLAAADPTFDPTKIIANVKYLLLACVGVVLIGISLQAAMDHGKRGNTKGAWNTTVATVICMIPAAIGIAGIAIALATGGLKAIGVGV